MQRFFCKVGNSDYAELTDVHGCSMLLHFTNMAFLNFNTHLRVVVTDFTERGRQREREREKHRCERNIDQLPPVPTQQKLSLQARYVPLMEIEPITFWYLERRSI